MTVLMVSVRIKTDIVAVRTRQYNVCCFVYYIYVYIIYIVFPKWGINVSIVKRHIFDVQKKKDTHIRVIRYNS